MENPDASRWKELYARTGDDLAAAREILKDAGTVTRWSRQIVADIQRQRDARRNEQNARRNETEARQQDQQKAQQDSPAPSTEPNQSFSEPVISEPVISEPVISEPVIVVRLDGNFDLVRSPSVLDLFRHLAADLAAGEQRTDPGGQRLVVDLRGVKLIDASGIACLITCRRMLARTGHRLVVLLAPGSQPQAVFEKGSLGRIMTEHSSLDDL